MAESPPEPPRPPLYVTSPGATMVATDELLDYRGRLTELADELARQRRLVCGLEREPWTAIAGRPALAEIMMAGDRIGEAERMAVGLRDAVEAAMRNYAEAEKRAERAQQLLAAALASQAAPAILLLLASLLATSPGWLPPLLALGAIGDAVGVDPTAELLAPARSMLSTQEGVRAVELVAASGDEAALSLTGIPALLAFALGGFGASGVDRSTAAAITAARPLGLLQETPVQIDRIEVSRDIREPSGAADRFARIPSGDQVRVEVYQADGMPDRVMLYLGGTEDFSPRATDEPWDLTSNVTAVAGASAGSLRAAELALEKAGVTADAEIMVLGYSQGGLVAERLLAERRWNTVGVETYGAPTGTVPLPAGTPGMEVRHRDDLVPALAGPHPSPTLLQVERDAFPDGAAVPRDQAMPAHQRERYLETAGSIDAARSPEVRAHLDRMTAFTAEYASRPGYAVTRYDLHAVRLPATAS
jgi:hypothetical protein